MSSYAHPHMKFGRQPTEPASPVRSYQSSSQSETTPHSSPSGASSSFSSYTNPSWATPLTPQPFHGNPPSSPHDGSPTGGLIVFSSPPSPEFSEGSDDRHSHGDESSQQRGKRSNREARANALALSLLDATAGSDVRVRAMSAPHVSSSSRKQSSMPNYNSRSQASERALDLLSATVGVDVKASATFAPSNLPGDVVNTQEVDESVKDHKRSLDRLREREANIRALSLLDATVGAGVNAEARLASNPQPKPALNARQAAIKNYEEKQRIKAQMKAKLKADLEKNAKKTPHSYLAARYNSKESLAESSRKITKTAEDVRDPETVAGMKCQMDIEREERAKKRALQMMKYGMIA